MSTESTETVAVPKASFWGSLKQAVGGAELDFTEGPLSRAVILLAVPMVLEMVMESVFAICDVFFVSRLGAEAVATVGLTESLLTVVFSLAIGLGMGTTAMVARRIGEKRPEAAAIAAAQAVVAAIFASVILGIAGLWTAPTALRLVGASQEVLSLSLVSYTYVSTALRAAAVAITSWSWSNIRFSS